MLELDEAERVLDLSSADARAARERMTLLLAMANPSPELLAEMKRLEGVYLDMIRVTDGVAADEREESALVRGVLAHVPRQLEHLRAAISQVTATLAQRGTA